MSVNKMSYNSEKVALLKQLLVNSKENGKPIDYEIRVDGMRAVPRTNDPEQFDRHEDFIDADTSSVTILLYEGASRNNNRHIFLMKDEPKSEPKNKPLSGVEVDKMVNERVEEIKQQMKYDQLKKENQEQKEELKEAYGTVDKLRKMIGDMQNQKGIDSLNWGKVAGAAAEAIIRNNPHIIARIPGGEALAGIIVEDNKKQEQSASEPQKETEATFSKKPADTEPPLTDDEKKYRQIMQYWEENLDQEQINHVTDIINTLIDKPEAIEQTKTFAEKYDQKPIEKKEEKTKESESPKQTQKIKVEEKKIDEQNTVSDNSEEDNPSDILAAC
jgi:hypothetical protein